jgi:prolyl-tRNA editing enzyme YbaK/EbsC (Cys-tRNA(Pro) deacylase)
MRQKVIDTARELGLEVDVRRLSETTATVGDAARAVGCQEAEIAKSLVFVADGDAVLCIASGGHRVDPRRLADALDVAEVRQATPDEVRAATGFPVGGVPPFGHDLPVVFDESLLEHERVYAAGGDGNSLFEVDPRRLLECTGATPAPVSGDQS